MVAAFHTIRQAKMGLISLAAMTFGLVVASTTYAQSNLPAGKKADLQIEIDVDQYRASPMGEAFPFVQLINDGAFPPGAMGPADLSKINSIKAYVRLPKDVASVMAAGMSNGAIPMDFRVEIDLGDKTAAADAKEFFESMSEGSDTVGGIEFLRMPDSPPNLGIIFPNDTTVVIGTDDYLGSDGNKLVSDKTHAVFESLPNSPIRLAGDLSGSDAFFRELEQMMEMMAPPDAQELLAALPGVASVSLVVNPNGSELMNLTMNSRTEADLEGVGSLMDSLATQIRMPAEMSDQAPPEAAPMISLMKEIAAGTKVTTAGTRSQLTIAAPANFIDRLKTDVVPAIQKAAEKTRQLNDLRQICLAMHNYESAYRKFPQGPNENGTDMSWRVEVLPYLEEFPLYERVDFEQDWNSEDNSFLADSMPRFYGEGGRDTLFAAVTCDNQPTVFGNLGDGASNTICFVKLNKPIPWAANKDVTIDEVIAMFADMKGEGEVLVAMYDGSVRPLPASINPANLRAMLTPDAGDDVDWSFDR